ncbi:MAG: outer membrane beta-barrel protein [Rhodopseudomonas palustris]|nr:outer membrane beta-barrel protein [Rhodopseudomonas palustris]
MPASRSSELPSAPKPPTSRPRPPSQGAGGGSYDWTGFYLGVNAGVGMSRTFTSHNYPAGGTLDSTYLQSEGAFGGQIGYNWQTNAFPVFGPVLFGIEADIQGSGASNGDATLNSGTGLVGYNQKLDWFGTVRGRVGEVRGPLVSYFTGGFAAGDVKTSVVGTNIGPYSFNRTQTGWTIGSGVEAALGGNWTGKIEYLYLNLGNKNDFIADQALHRDPRTVPRRRELSLRRQWPLCPGAGGELGQLLSRWQFRRRHRPRSHHRDRGRRPRQLHPVAGRLHRRRSDRLQLAGGELGVRSGNRLPGLDPA